jgi:hypothetical protein
MDSLTSWWPDAGRANLDWKAAGAGGKAGPGMIFQYTLDQVLDGRKTQTRRLVTAGRPSRWRVGRTYAVQPGRTKKAVARIEVTGGYQAAAGKDRPGRSESRGLQEPG